MCGFKRMRNWFMSLEEELKSPEVMALNPENSEGFCDGAFGDNFPEVQDDRAEYEAGEIKAMREAEEAEYLRDRQEGR